MSYGRRHALYTCAHEHAKHKCANTDCDIILWLTRTRGKEGKLPVFILHPLSISLFSSPGAACGVDDAGFESALYRAASKRRRGRRIS